MTEPIPRALRESRVRVAALLHFPGNLGIQFRTVGAGPKGHPPAVAVFVDGMADADRVWRWVVEPLQQTAEGTAVMGRLTAPRLRPATDLDTVVAAVLSGETALLVDGSDRAALVDTRPDSFPGTTQGTVTQLGEDLTGNLTLLRQRLRDPALVAEPVDTPRATAAAAALVYLKGKADPGVLGQVRDWVRSRAGEEAFRRGLPGGVAGQMGMLPVLTGTQWPGKIALLLDVGHVAVLVDRIPYAFMAPVTAPSLLTGPADEAQRRPVIGAKRFLRVLLAMTVLLEGALIVAVLEYHQELFPTPFLLALASVRETAALPVVATVIGLNVTAELVLQMPYRIQLKTSAGQAVLAYLVMVSLATFTGLVGPMAAVGSVLSLVATTGLVCYDLRYLVRAWRWPLIGCAAVFGLFGVSAGLFFLAAYLTRSQSFGVPFIAETGSRFTAPGRQATGQEGMT